MTKPLTPVRKKPLVRKKPKPRGRTRPFYLHGYIGRGQPDGSISADKLISAGPYTNMGGFDLDIYVKTGATTAALAIRLEGRATAEGRITLKARAMQKKGEPLLYDGESWRDGKPPEVDPSNAGSE